VRAVQDFTSNTGELISALSRVHADGETALYTALYVTLDKFRRMLPTNDEVRRQAIVVLTDGEDTTSAIRYEDVLDAARRAGVAIYTISIISPFEAETLTTLGERRFASEADYALRTLARETGGRAFFPIALRELAGVYRSVADELATEYALGYVPKVIGNDGVFHRLAVRILSHPEARPRTRTGYYAAGSSHAALMGR